ncbi:MAG: transcription antitermination factor NusB [candidate division Zixibacteria bacterium]|nr:transcription antitermination factor NusB [candidate division Zixibacteria bacterium]MCI0595417.1 transcription antitermination factor NusB [candidate division Zixibacteria bacterium]
MKGRHRVRELVLSCLYAVEQEAGAPEEILKTHLQEDQLDGKEKEFARALFEKTFVNRGKLDGEIEPKLKNWKLSRIALLDRIIMRMALAEWHFFPDIPEKVSIDEAVELAKKFSTAESGHFVNGILDAIFKDPERRNAKLV